MHGLESGHMTALPFRNSISIASLRRPYYIPYTYITAKNRLFVEELSDLGAPLNAMPHTLGLQGPTIVRGFEGLGLRYSNMNGNWDLKPQYFGPWTLRVSSA